MKNVLTILEMIVSVILIVLILIQSGDAGISGVWTGGGETFHTKRGVEKIVFGATIAAATIFILLAVGILLVN